LYFHDELIINDAYKLTAGMRYDYSSSSGGILNPRLALVGSPYKNLTAKLLYGHAYKAPTVFELFDEWHGSDKLKAQGIKTAELELSYLVGENLNFRGNYYYSMLDNLINITENPDPVAVPIGPNGEHETYYQNVGSTNMSGYTFSVDQRVTEDLAYTINYTGPIGENGDEIENVARHKINFAVNYLLWNNFNISLRGNYIGKVKAPLLNRYFYPKTEASIAEVGYDYVIADNPNGYLPSHFIINLSLRAENLFGEGIKLEPELIIRNLLNTDYYTAGRQLIMGVRPVDEIQTSIQNPEGYNPAYHPQPGREVLFRLVYNL
jgi:outer membrane receptor for ferrienterochelin and colicin